MALQLAEIDENLCRAELTPTQEAEHLARRKELWEARQNQVETPIPPEIGYKKPPPQTEAFAASTAEATGRTKQHINKAVKRATEVCQEARDLIRGTKLDTGAYLDKLAGVTPHRHRSRADRP